jgi:hypothetical protein
MSELTVKTAIDLINDERKKKLGEVELVWDQFAQLASSVILALSLLSFTVDFFKGTKGVTCFHPSNTASGNELTLSQATFINQFCSDSLPITEYFPIYILLHGLMLIFPHYVWRATFKGHFDGFFSIAVKINRLQDNKNGEYCQESFCRVEKLQKKYGGRSGIFSLFVVKLVLQLALSFLFLGINAVLFQDFSFSFSCTLPLEEVELTMNNQPQNITTFPCVYTSFRFLRVVWFIDLILIALVAVMAIYGLMWCFWKHGRQLGHYLVAEFAFQSLLEPNFFELPRFTITSHSPKSSNCCCLKFEDPRKSIYPRIKSDLDFLSLVLYRSDPFYGQVFRDILVSFAQRFVILDHSPK